MIPIVVAMLLAIAPVEVRDTLHVGSEDERVASLAWEPGAFAAQVLDTPGRDGEAVVQFPSPRRVDVHTDEVALLWYRAVTDGPGAAPAVVIVHSLHPDQPVAKMLARLLRQQGIHAFVLQLPGYGLRRVPGRPPGVIALERSRQAVADVRRAADVVAALPGVGDVSLAGISLGGFAAATAASLDNAYAQVFLITTGAGAPGVFAHGSKDARLLRLQLEKRGYDADALAEMLDPVDPAHFVHRLDPQQAWLFSARYDVTIPQPNIRLLAETIGLPEGHHIWMETNHYTAIFALPAVAQVIVGEVTEANVATSEPTATTP